MIQMDVQGLIDAAYVPHGKHQGLSVGWLALIFLVYTLTEADHKLVSVQQWVAEHQQTLERLTGQTIRPTDFTDDRLADVLRYLSQDEVWWQVEQKLSQRLIRVYDLQTKGTVRLDATVGGVNHHAVDITLKLGGKIVWLPTLHARAFISKKDHVKNLAGQLGEGLEGLYLLDEHGELDPRVYPVLRKPSTPERRTPRCADVRGRYPS